MNLERILGMKKKMKWPCFGELYVNEVTFIYSILPFRLQHFRLSILIHFNFAPAAFTQRDDFFIFFSNWNRKKGSNVVLFLKWMDLKFDDFFFLF